MDLSSFPPEHHSLLSLANGILRVPGLVLIDWLCRVWDDPGNRNFLSALGPPALVTLVLLCAALALFLLRGELEDLVELYCAAIAVACHVAADQLSLAVLNEARGGFQEGIDKEDGAPLHWSYSTMFLALLCLCLAHPVARVCLRDGGHLNPLSSPSVYSLCLLPLLFGWVHLGAISLDRLFWIHNNMRYGLAIFLCCSFAIKIFTVVGYLIYVVLSAASQWSTAGPLWMAVNFVSNCIYPDSMIYLWLFLVLQEMWWRPAENSTLYWAILRATASSMKSPVTISAGAVGFGALHSVAVTALRAAFSSMGIITDVGLFEGSGLLTASLSLACFLRFPVKGASTEAVFCANLFVLSLYFMRDVHVVSRIALDSFVRRTSESRLLEPFRLIFLLGITVLACLTSGSIALFGILLEEEQEGFDGRHLTFLIQLSAWNNAVDATKTASISMTGMWRLYSKLVKGRDVDTDDLNHLYELAALLIHILIAALVCVQAFYKLFDGGSEIIDFCAFLSSKGFLIYNDQASVMENYRRRRMSSSIISKLPLASDEHLRAHDDRCSICWGQMLSSSEDGEARSTPCGHLFHEKCLGSWLRRRGTCPLCNANLVALVLRGGQDDVEENDTEEENLSDGAED